MSRPTILLCGDSLTQNSFEGWGARLAHVYQRRADVLNRGYSGYNTRYYRLLLHDLSVHDPLLVIVWFGANDAALSTVDPHHHVPIPDYQTNLEAICQHFPNSKILLVTPPPVHHEQRLRYQRDRYGDQATGVLERTLEHTGLYAVACRQVASVHDIPCLDIYHRMLAIDEWNEFLSDGLHLSERGNQFVLEQILQAIATHFPQIAVTPDAVTGQFGNSASSSQLQQHGPYHDQIDHLNPLATFPQDI